MSGAPTTYIALCKIAGGIDPDVVGRYLDLAREGAGDHLSETQSYVDLARPETSPVHATLCWDDEALAEAARRAAAGLYFRCVLDVSQIEHEGVSIRINGPLYQHYSASDTLESSDLRLMALDDLLKRIIGDLRNHSYLGEELTPLLTLAEEIRASVKP